MAGDDGRTLLVIEEAIPDIYRGPQGPPPDPDRPIYRCSVIIMSADGKTATVVWTHLGRIEGIDARAKPLAARLFKDSVVLVYRELGKIGAQVFRRDKNGGYSNMPGETPLIWPDRLTGPQTIGARVEGDIDAGTVVVTLEERQYDAQWTESFRLIAGDVGDAWRSTGHSATRPAAERPDGPDGP